MARKRMFDNDIINQDKFLDLPTESKALYFLLGMEADDEGFVAPKRVMRLHNIAEDNLKVLIAKNFVIAFESGVIVITDWKRNNYIDKNKSKATIYTEEKSLLAYDNDKQQYTLISIESTVKPKLNQSLTKVKKKFTQNRLDKNRLDKISIDKNRIDKSEFDKIIDENFSDGELKNTVYEFIKMRKTIKKPFTERGLELMIKKLYTLTTDVDEQIEIINNSIMNNWQGIFPLKQNRQYKSSKGNFDDFKELWKEAGLEDEQAGNNTDNSVDSW